MENRDRILKYLKEHPGGIDDDDLAAILKLPQRQQANARCRELAQDGLIRRVKVHGKINNFWIDDPTSIIVKGVAPTYKALPSISMIDSKPWFWEGNVQSTIVTYLVTRGYSIISVADTASKRRGKDIEASIGGRPVWVTVKGYPEGKKRTHPSTQSGHWFKQAIFDIIEYRGQNSDAELFLGLPDYERYRKLASKVEWLIDVAKFRYIWVSEDGSLSVP